MIEKKHFLALLAAGSLPAMALAVPVTTSLGQSNDPTLHASDIHWLQIPASVTEDMYTAAQPIAGSVPVNGQTATLDALVTGSTNVTSTGAAQNGHLKPLSTPTWNNSTAFGRTDNYSGAGQVAIGVSAYNDTNKYVGTSSVAFKSLKLTGPDGRSWSFQLVAADAESTDQPGEQFSGTTDGNAWQLIGTLLPNGTPSTPSGGPLGTGFTYTGTDSTKLGKANVLSTLNPANVSVTLKAGSAVTGGAATAQAMAIGVWPLVPEVTVVCPIPATPAASQNCTVSVVNPPREAFTITLDPKTGIDPASSCLAAMSFPVGTTTQSCEMKMAPGITGTVTADAQPTATALAGWKITPDTVTLYVPVTPPGPGPGGATAVPVGDKGLLALMAALIAGMAGWSLRKRRTH